MKYLKKHYFWTLPLLLIIDGLFFGLTNPQKVNSLLLIVGYLLLVVTLYRILRLLGRAAGLYGVPQVFANRTANALTGVGALCLALSSVGELTSRDIAVILPLGVLLYVYSYYAKTRKV